MTNELPTIDEIRTAAIELAGSDSDQEHIDAATLMVASTVYGPDPERLAGLTGLPEAFVARVATNLYNARIWHDDGRVHCNWLDEESGGMAFQLDLLVALGLLAVVPDAGAGEGNE